MLCRPTAGRTLVRRLALAPLLLLVTAALVMQLPALTGSDPARSVQRARYAESTPDADDLARLRAELGYDQPLVHQYVSYVGTVVRGDLGVSSVSRTPVLDEVRRAVGVSVQLMVAALVAALTASLPAGLVAAHRPGGVVDRLVSAVSRVAVAVPEYVVGPVLVLVFAIHFGWLPSSGWAGLQHQVLPALCLALFPAAVLAQLVRSEAIDVLDEPFIRTAHAAGVASRRVAVRHVGRLAMVAPLGAASTLTAGMLGGAVMVEVVFGIPGLGRLLHQAVTHSDIPMLQGTVLTIVAAALVIGIAADALHRLLDPRVQA